MTQAKRVLILGGGFAGLSALHTLSGQDLQITLVDQRNYHLFQPLLYQVATGELLGEVIATPFRKLGQGNNWRFHLGEVQRIDLSQRKVCLRNNEILPYDYLLLALGTVTNFFGNESITNHALQIKGLEEAEIARSKIFLALENASNCPDPEQRKSWLRFVIAGGGAAGVEFCGALLETLRELLPREYPELHFSETEIILVHGGEALLPGFAPSLQEHAAARLRELGAELRLQTHVQDFDGFQVHCDQGPAIVARTLVWTAGVMAPPLLESLPGERGKGGRIKVDPYLRLPDFPEVFVLGDLAVSKEDDFWPQVAPFAMQSGRYAARFIIAQAQKHGMPAPFSYRDPGSMAVVGRLDGVCQIHGWVSRGAIAWILWLLLHLYRIIGTGNRLRTLLDWFSDYFRRNNAVQLIRPLHLADGHKREKSKENGKEECG
ncbi:MAG: NAD(P)/FAD-dependent oxidoreductase [Acidithiobacillus sp.]|nr:NAD(P)/FAD-dependent oxidoreductase [Acidithiobacillus sp.]